MDSLPSVLPMSLGIRSFPFGARSIFMGELSVLGSVVGFAFFCDGKRYPNVGQTMETSSNHFA